MALRATLEDENLFGVLNVILILKTAVNAGKTF